MKKLLLSASLLIFTSAAFSQQVANGSSRIYSYGDHTTLEITGASAEVIYRSLKVQPEDVSDGRNTSNQKVSKNISCTETISKKTRKSYFKCEMSVDLNSGSIDESAAG